MIYRIYNPIPALSDVIEHFWYSKVELSGSLIQYHPTPLLQGLTFNFYRQEEDHSYQNKTVNLYQQAHFFGQPTCPRTIIRTEKEMNMLGVKFKPLGITKITGINMEHMVNGIIAVEDIWCDEFKGLSDEIQSANSIEQSILILESFLLKKRMKTRLHYRIDNVYSALRFIEGSKGGMSIKDIQNQTNTSRKTLERAFLHYLGLKPKFYSQIVRFNNAKTVMDNPSLGKVYELGYYDESHFASEFKRFSGLTPTEHIKERQQAQGLVSFCPFFPKRHLFHNMD